MQARNPAFCDDFHEAADENMSGLQAVALRAAADEVLLDSVIVTGRSSVTLRPRAGDRRPAGRLDTFAALSHGVRQ